MEPPRLCSARWWLRLGLAFSIWTLLGLFEASHSYIQYAYEGDPLRWGQALALGLSLWYAWAILAVFAFTLARRFPIGIRTWQTRLPFHLAGGAFFALVKLAMDYPIIMLFYC